MEKKLWTYRQRSLRKNLFQRQDHRKTIYEWACIWHFLLYFINRKWASSEKFSFHYFLSVFFVSFPYYIILFYFIFLAYLHEEESDPIGFKGSGRFSVKHFGIQLRLPLMFFMLSKNFLFDVFHFDVPLRQKFFQAEKKKKNKINN